MNVVGAFHILKEVQMGNIVVMFVGDQLKLIKPDLVMSIFQRCHCVHAGV